MSRYERKNSLPNNLYVEGSPVVISAGALLHDTVNDKMLVQLKLRNIGANTIQAVKVDIKAYNQNGQEIEGVKDFQYSDLNVAHGEEFGQKTPIYLPDNSAEKYDVDVTEVDFKDAETWKRQSFEEWQPLESQKTTAALLDEEMLKQYTIEVGDGKSFDQTAEFIPDITLDLFRCTCGDINPESSTKCLKCGRDKEKMFDALDTEYLKSKCYARVDEEKTLNEQKTQETIKKNKIKKQKNKKFIKLGIILGIVVVLLVSGTVIGLNIYKDYKKDDAIRHSLSDITGNTWKSLSDSEKTFSVNDNGGSYGDNSIAKWDYKAPVLDISYYVEDSFYDDTTKEKVVMTLSWLNDDILQLTDKDSGERFVQEKDYNKATELKDTSSK